ncbi:MAG: ComEC/Rec2 family competence protein [Actinomycetes bacterium]
MIVRATPAIILVVVLAGGAIGGRVDADPIGPLVLTAASAAAGVVLLAAGRRPAAGIAALLAVGAFATGSAARAVDGLERSGLRAPSEARSRGALTGAVVGDPVATAWRVVVTVRSATWTGERSGRRTAVVRSVLVVAAAADQSRFRSLVAGDRVAVRGRLGPLDGYDARLRVRHVVARLDDATLVDLGSPRAPVLRLANSIRSLVARGGAGLPARERGVLAAFLLGDERAIPPDTIATFRAAGMSHLLVVSGANVAAVLALVGPLTRRAPLLVRAVVGVGVLALFGAVTRWEPSVLRAIAMATTVLVGTVLGRPVRGARVLALAVAALLLVDPFLVRSVGFRLSCAATAGIAILATPIADRLPGPRVLRDAFGVTTAAQVGVAPVLLGTFGAMPAVAIPANLLAAPLVVPITVWGLGAGLLGGLLGGVPAQVLQIPTLVALRAVEGLAALGARHPGSLDARALTLLVALVATTAGVVRLARIRRPPGSGVGVGARR